jgi:putative membrane protein
MAILVNWLISALAIIVAAYLLPGVSVSGIGVALILAVVLGLINAVIRPIILLLTLPVNVLTLGLFTFVINALMIILADAVTPGFAVRNFWWALAFSIILALINSVLKDTTPNVLPPSGRTPTPHTRA